MPVSRLSVCACHCENPTSRWTGDLWLKRVALLFAYLWTFLCFCCFDDLLGFEIFSSVCVCANQPTVNIEGISRPLHYPLTSLDVT